MNVKRIMAIAMTAVLVLGICGCSCSSGGSQAGGTSAADVKYSALDYVTLGDYEGVEVEITKARYEVTDKQINSKMRELCNSGVIYEVDPNQQVVTVNSIVNVDYVGKLDDVAFEGGSAQDVWIDVANNSDAQSGTSYIDGFSNGVVGARVGSVASYGITFPENYGNSDLAGKYVVFDFTINSIAKDPSVDYTDTFVQQHSEYNSVDELRAAATAEVESELAKEKKEAIDSAVSRAVIDNCTVNSYPQKAVDARVNEYISYYEKNYATDGTSLKDYIQTNYGMSLDEFKQEIRSSYESQLKTQLIFEAIAEKQNITLDEEGYKAYAEKMAEDNGFASVDTMYAYYSDGEDVDAGESYLRKIYVCQKALDYCVSKAVINEV